MPPPGIPDWVFPGAVVEHMNGSPQYAIGTLNLHTNQQYLEVILQRVVQTDSGRVLDDEMMTLLIADLILEWRHTGTYLPVHELHARGTPSNRAIVGEYFRWQSPPPNERITVIYVERIEEGEIVATVITFTSELEERIPLEEFGAARLRGTCVHLGYDRLFAESRASGEILLPGMVLLDSENREIFLLSRNRDATWVVLAAHDLRPCPSDYLITCQALTSHEGDMAEVAVEDPSIDAPLNFSVGDRWHLDAPNEGIWTIEQVCPDEGPYRTYSFKLRSEDGAVMKTFAERLVHQGRRISPPDPRFTGAPIEVGQLWEIPTNVTRQKASRWKVSHTATHEGVTTVKLEPEGSGTAISWPDGCLRAQGRCLGDGRVRKPALQRVWEDDDG